MDQVAKHIMRLQLLGKAMVVLMNLPIARIIGINYIKMIKRKKSKDKEKEGCLKENHIVSLQAYMVGCEDGIGYSQSRYSF